MSSLFTKIVEASDEKVKERLTFLLNSARGKLRIFELELEEMFRNPQLQEGVQIVGKRAIEQYKMYSVDVEQTPTSQITDVIKKFFEGTDAAIQGGIIGLVELGLNTVLGNRTAGETEQSLFFIIPDKLNLIRVDVKVWRYNFTSKDIYADIDNAVCYIFTKSIIDHTTLTADELIYFISRISGGDFNKALELIDNLKVLVEKLQELYNLLKDMNPQVLLEKYLENRPSYAQRIYNASRVGATPDFDINEQLNK